MMTPPVQSKGDLADSVNFAPMCMGTLSNSLQ